MMFCGGGEQGTAMPDEAHYDQKRRDMVDTQIIRRGIKDPRVIQAMLRVKRHKFVPDDYLNQAYDDGPLPIGEGQTISQPYIVAYMTEILQIEPDHKILEIGTGSGYQAAVLSELTPHVYSMDIIKTLVSRARETLAAEGFSTVKIRHGDGYKGWPEEAPFDAIIVTCAPDDIPGALVAQLKEGGRMIIPIGGVFSTQQLVLAKKMKGKIKKKEVLPVRFVPMIKRK
jgi:protein-L-isoaspartate(D-aspartate) O-methyltransferase